MKRSVPSSAKSDIGNPHKRSKIDMNTPEDHDVDGWTKVAKRKQKKGQKNQQVQESLAPHFAYSSVEIRRRNNPIGIDEIRDLVLHLTADAPPPNWCRVENVHLVEKTLILLVPGITPDILSLELPTSAIQNPNIPLSIPLTPPAASPFSVPFIASTFSHACPTRAPGDATRMHSVHSTFFNGPISRQEKQKRETMRALGETWGKDPDQYLLTLEQMVENDYPIPSYMADVFQKPDASWIETPKAAEPSILAQPNSKKLERKIYGIDCEMCLTEDGKVLTHVCMIDYYSDQVVYDQLVKPEKPVLDYLTRWSGITAEALAPVTTTLEDVQSHILKLLSPPPPNPFSSSPQAPSFQTPILIGHSLESDLHALKLCHPCCIDTALLYHHPRGRPLKPGLAWLTKKWCNREIQARGDGGHDPEEDARACLDLVRKKIQEGPEFGEFKIDYESVFERMSKSSRKGDGRSAVVDHGNPSVMHGSKATTCVSCASDDDVVASILETLPSHRFVFGRFLELAAIRGWTSPKDKDRDPAAPPAAPPPDPEQDQLSLALTKVNEHLKTIYAALPPRTAFLIFTGHSDPRKMSTLSQRKNAFEAAARQGKKIDEFEATERWSTSDARELEEQVALARRGLLFLGVKK